MFELSAPHPRLTTTTLLPNPEFSDSEALTANLSARRAVDGTLYTYVKTKNGRKKLLWSFRLTRNKSLELRAFLQSYHGSKCQITDHNDRVWIGYFTNNPFEFSADERAYPAISPMPRGETVTIQLEFEGTEVV